MTRVDRLAAYFTAWPDRWIDGRELGTIAGVYAWRSSAKIAERVWCSRTSRAPHQPTRNGAA